MSESMNEGVLVIYTGGTFGSVRSNAENPEAPLIPGNMDNVKASLPLVKGDRMILNNTEVKVDMIEYAPLLDSTMIKPRDWVKMAETVRDYWNQYEGFVIIHGTDTMAFASSVLPFMFTNLSKPVIITGSQRAIGETRSDAVQNLVTAVEIAAAGTLGATIVPEVCVFFRDYLLRGCRTTKHAADAYQGFSSPNLPPLGIAGEHIEIEKRLVRPMPSQDFQLRTDLNQNIAVLELSPLMSYSLLESVLTAEGLQGAILKTYGTGNAPTDGEFLDIIKRAVDSGVHVVDVTQCSSGTVELGLYEVSAGLLERGVISGMDMTSEAAQTKLAVLLQDNTQLDSVRDLMQVNLRGEMDSSLFDIALAGGTADPAFTAWQTGTFPCAKYFDNSLVEKAKLRLLNLRAEGISKGQLSLSVFLAAPDADESTAKEGPRYVHVGGIEWDSQSKDSTNVFIDVTEAVKRFIDPGAKLSITIVSDTGTKISWEDMRLAVYA